MSISFITCSLLLTLLFLIVISATTFASPKFHVQEATVSDVHKALKSGELTVHELVEYYLKRIDAYDQQGPKLNAIIMVNTNALEQADKLDAEFKKIGKFVGPLHGIPVLLKTMSIQRTCRQQQVLRV